MLLRTRKWLCKILMVTPATGKWSSKICSSKNCFIFTFSSALISISSWCTYQILPKLALSQGFNSVIISALWHAEYQDVYQDAQAHFFCFFLKHWYHAKIERFLSTPKGPLSQNLPNVDGSSSIVILLYKSMLGDARINHVVSHQRCLQCVLFLALTEN